MTTHPRPGHAGSLRPYEAEQLPYAFAAAFNSGSPDTLSRIYADGAVFVPRPGTCVSGRELVAASTAFQALGVPIRVEPRHVYATGDTALLVVDWVLEGEGRDRARVHVEGTATDVARRGADGVWRYVIDNPFGTAAAA
ncbi:DUF4440 domain-containing protein [Streptomyces sp. NBC_01808]|uniref:YybH family protein n=1 Tax=Streptomyces sp. NBC_01808 TaxID=2975947 RepID=UPI002DDB3A06|nr:DUF4440 domain-containing protein [Streptomyces sp. NBC_01808]WSA38061.1 DUF4440 domain-containing protein [Streptomyces sp. NBC_01808]